ncbi:unnamed protein product [Rotaria sp. Silwood1]|nr:unnamed protein product [Rotaria sp. Silwood1]CAF4765925.1 unnamed protein product [Rotaria sp. Silwood1]CAF4876383.1 unnamed protein product [Rotaria sp. Silwood1]CAF4944985.1 unnamed protein product [Rotaria sp. Silwood1]
MSRSIRDLRELICLSRFGFRSDENDLNFDNNTTTTNNNNENIQSNNTILFYFDPSILNNWLEITSSRLEKIHSLTTNTFINFIYFWLKQFDYEHKQSLFQMEFELFIEHLLLSFTPNDIDSLQINQFARQILHDIDKQIGIYTIENDYNFIYYIDVFNRYKRDNQYRTLLADLPNELTININNRLHLQWMLAIRAFGLLAICTAAVEFFEKIQKTLEQTRTTGEIYSSQTNDQFVFNNSTDQFKNRILTALRKDYIDVIEYFIKTKQLTGDYLDEQNRNILFHALPMGNISMIEYLLKSNLSNFDINSITQSGNSLLHSCVTLQRIDLIELLIKYYPNININQRNKQDATPLHLAIIYNDIDIIRFLIQAGANTKLTMKTKTCLQLSIELNHENLIEFFSNIV